VDTIAGLKAAIADLRAALADPADFKKIYLFCFNWAKEEGQKSMDLDSAKGMWDLLLRSKFGLLDKWSVNYISPRCCAFKLLAAI
jgi:DCN1-like protein 1/2